MRKFLIPLIGASLIAVSMNGFAFGEREHRDACGKHGGFHKAQKMMARVLDLTDEQKAEIKTIKESYQAGDCERPLAKSMVDINPSDPDYVNQLEILSDKAAAAAKQRVLTMGEMRQKIEAVLTEEQIAKLAAVKADRLKKHEERKQKASKQS